MKKYKKIKVYLVVCKKFFLNDFLRESNHLNQSDPMWMGGGNCFVKSSSVFLITPRVKVWLMESRKSLLSFWDSIEPQGEPLSTQGVQVEQLWLFPGGWFSKMLPVCSLLESPAGKRPPLIFLRWNKVHFLNSREIIQNAAASPCWTEGFWVL